MVVTKFTKSKIQYSVNEFEKKYPNHPKLLQIEILQSIRTNLEDNTCEGHTSYMIENYDTHRLEIIYCCSNGGLK